MKTIKRVFFSIFILFAVMFLLRGWVYRNTVSYRSAGLRTNYTVTDPDLKAYIEKGSEENENPIARDLARRSLSLTSDLLSYSTAKSETDPNKLIHTKTAHCVGYAAFFAGSCNHLFKKYGLSDTWVAKPRIGAIHFLGINVHKYFSSPFFKDHDFVTIENMNSGEVFAVDPTVHDYLSIEFVTYDN